jgi:hypothetical protein
MSDFKYAKLRVRILEKFGTYSKFAEALNKSTVYLSRKLKGKTQFSSNEIKKWCYLLDISLEEVGLYFFA